MTNDNSLSSNWQVETDNYGVQRRFRMVGNIKEYEMMINIDGMEIPQSELTAFHERNKAIKEATRAAEQRAVLNKPTIKICPFRANYMKTECICEECAFYEDGCALAMIEQPTRTTANLKCPLRGNRKCISDCALFKENGCALTAIKSKREDNRHE